jgi:hypothetical protein
MALTKEQILAAADRREALVQVAEWGGDVLLREMSAAERVAFELAIGNDERRLRTLLVIWCAVDAETGERLFEVGDAPALEKKSWRSIKRLSDAALTLNAQDEAAGERLRENFTVSR